MASQELRVNFRKIKTERPNQYETSHRRIKHRIGGIRRIGGYIYRYSIYGIGIYIFIYP